MIDSKDCASNERRLGDFNNLNEERFNEMGKGHKEYYVRNIRGPHVRM